MTPAGVPAKAHVFVPSLDDVLTVAGDDGHHLARVLRVHAGQVVTAADGNGAWRIYDVAAVDGGAVRLVATGVVAVEPEVTPRIAVAFALTKEKPETTVKHLTELGVDRIIPVEMARSVVRWDAPKRAAAQARLTKVVREAGMQCRRARLPVVAPVTDLAAVLDHPGLVVADAATEPFHAVAPKFAAPEGGEWCVVIGPEGGFDDDERSALRAASPFPPVAVGSHVLRAETAALAVTAVLVAQRDFPFQNH